jgi:hypothetical protein
MLAPEGARLCALALDAALRSRQRNGRPPGDPLRYLASVLALAAPQTAVHLRAVLITAGPDVTAAVEHMAEAQAGEGVAAPAPKGSQAASSVLSASQVAAMTGYTVHGVRTACRRGRLTAVRTDEGWAITRQAVEEWRARSAA